MCPHKVRAYTGGTWDRLIAPFRGDGSFRVKRARTPFARSGPLNVLLRFFGKDLSESKPNADVPLQYLGKNTAEDSDRRDTHRGSLDWAPIQVLYEIPADSQQVEGSNSQPPSPWGERGGTTAFEHSSLESADTPEAAAGILKLQTITYPDEDRMALVDDMVSFLLTKETIDRLQQTIGASQSLKRYQFEFEDIKREANVGQSYIENVESQMSDPTLPEHLRNQMMRALEERKPSILADMQRKADMEQELGVRMIDLDYLRSQSDEIFERIMTDAGVFGTDPGPSSPEYTCEGDFDGQDTRIHDEASILNPGSPNQTPHGHVETLSAAQDEFESEEHQMDMAEQEHMQAWESLQMARELFDHREEAYRSDVAEHAAGLIDCPREEIDLHHLQQGAQLTRNLQDAEEEFERTRAQAKALNILVKSAAFAAESDGYRESQDPEQCIYIVNRDYIERWAAGVADAEDLHSPSAPSIDWSTTSVDISDSISVYNENITQRRRIDHWRAEQEVIRAEFSVDVE